MLYVAFLSFKTSLGAEEQRAGLARRAAYQYPEGISLKAEYWPLGPTQVVSIFEADSFEPMFRVLLEWQDIFDIHVYPATTAEGGLAIGAKLMGGQA